MRGRIEAADAELAMELLEKQNLGIGSLVVEPSISELLAAGKQEQQTNPAFMSGWMMIGLGALLQLSAYLVARGGLLTLAVIIGLAGTIFFMAGIIRWAVEPIHKHQSQIIALLKSLEQSAEKHGDSK